MKNDKILHEARAGQIHKFEDMGLLRGIVPTDIDLFVEYRGRLFVLGEGKYKDAKMMTAQRGAYEGLCNAIHELPHHEMWILIYRHEVHDVNEPVYVKDQYVIDTYNSIDLMWKEPTDIEVTPKFELINGKLTMREAMKQIENWCTENCKFNI